MFSFLKKFGSKPVAPVAPPPKQSGVPKATSIAKPAPAPTAPQKPVSAALSTSPATPQPAVEILSVSLASVVEHWPDALKARIAKPPRPADMLQLDLRKVTDQLASGSIKLSFKEIRDRSPAGLFADSPDAGNVIAELPLKLILPLLKAGQIRRRTDQKKSIVPEEIGPLFGAKGEPLRPTNGVAAPAKEPPQSQIAKEPEKPSPIRPPTPVIQVVSQPPAAEILRPLPIAPAPPTSVALPSGAGDALSIPIASLLEAWSGPGEQEFQQLRAETLSIPLSELENGLKRGKLVFLWSQLRTWIKPSSTSPNVNITPEKEIELPLKVIAPLFIARNRPAKSQKRVVIGDNIPNLFSGTPGEVPAPTPLPVPESTVPEARPKVPESAPVSPAIPMPSLAPKPRSPVGEIFGQPNKDDWSPAEIVQKVAGMNGVSGALIVLSDGLLVAGQLAAGLSKENVAAFIPQMFGRIVQYTAELKPGETDHVTVILQNTAIQIFKKGGLFFAVIGRDNGSMPTAHLSVIATHLARSPV